MIAVLVPLVVALATALFGLQRGACRRWSVHVLAISAVLLVIALARAASSGHASECALDFTPPVRDAVTKVQR